MYSYSGECSIKCIAVTVLYYHIFIFLVGGLLKLIEGIQARNIRIGHRALSTVFLKALRLLQAWLCMILHDLEHVTTSV